MTAAVTTTVTAADFMRSDPEFGGGLMVVLSVEGDGFLGQNLMIWSHGGLQEHIDPHLIGEAKQLQQHRFRGVQPQ